MTAHTDEPHAPVVLVAATGSDLVRAIQLLDQHEHTMGVHAVVGGIAVIVRLAQAHRATADIDSAVHDPEAAAATVAEASGGKKAQHRVVFEDGIKIDFLDASVPVDEALAFETQDDVDARYQARAILLRVAIDTATDVPVIITDPTATTLAEVNMRVVRPGLLLAAKSLSALDPQRGEDKRGTDIVDLVRLSEALPLQVLADDLGALPPQATSFHLVDLERITRREVGLSERWVRKTSRVDGREFPAERIAAAGDLIDLLTQRRPPSG